MQTLTIASPFSDNMVVQQGMDVPVWGTGAPGTDVTVQFGGQRRVVTVDASGGWRVVFAPLRANSTEQTLTVEADDPNESLTLTGILVGEVWLCSGQSNMEWPLAQSIGAASEIETADYPAIRLLSIPREAAREPRREIPHARWVACSPETAPTFSAVGYIFGRELHRRLGVPVGLVHASWGGTTAEAWTSREGLCENPTTREIVETFERELPTFSERWALWSQEIAAIDECHADRQNEGVARGWAEPGQPEGDWRPMQIPGAWQLRGLDFSGIVWFRKTVDVPSSWAGQDLRLAIGATDKSDVTYVNGEVVGHLSISERDDAWNVPRTYTVPGRLVRAGLNTIAVRVHSDKFAGGMTGPAAIMRLSLEGDRLTAIPLAGTWDYAVEANYGRVVFPAEPPNPTGQNAPSALFNAMIAPLLPMAMRGAIWYQGESNTGRATQYRTLFQALIRDWRRGFEREDLAFHFVQLPNYMARQDAPSDSQWARLREAQALALNLPHTGMAVTIDVGDPGDVHPRNKHDVGLRLAYSALSATYGTQDVVRCGPMFKEARREGAGFRLLFDHVAGGLVCNGDGLGGFAVAGADGQFAWANARIDGETVLVHHDTITEPVAVRYAWADNPAASLYNTAGLPAAPFRTDDFK